jgi:hypothetical protein
MGHFSRKCGFGEAARLLRSLFLCFGRRKTAENGGVLFMDLSSTKISKKCQGGEI